MNTNTNVKSNETSSEIRNERGTTEALLLKPNLKCTMQIRKDFER